MSLRPIVAFHQTKGNRIGDRSVCLEDLYCLSDLIAAANWDNDSAGALKPSSVDVSIGTRSKVALAEHDPLLFIEMIPNEQTRRFVFCVLRYSWAYAQQLNLPIPSLDALADGQFPRLTGTATTSIASSATIH